MKYLVSFMAMVVLNSLSIWASSEKEVTIKLIETSDVHGNYFPYNFIERKDGKGGLAHVHTFVEEQRKQYGDNVILVDNGDILQGQPIAYYYNYIDTVSKHVTADMMNFMGYDVANMGNHDVETGHAVYDRWVADCAFPVLGANIVRTDTGEPYLKPYQILERDGVRIAILGMITPAIPAWLPERLWSGLRFEDLESSARKWVQVIREKEHPDVLVGLFHAGLDGADLDGMVENGSQAAAVNVPGFDVVLIGHDHARLNKKMLNVAGDSVLVIDPANAARVVSDVTIKVTKQDGKVVRKQISGQLTDVTAYPQSEVFLKAFQPAYQATLDFVSRKIGSINETITSKDTFFGPSAFIDLIHQLQLDLTGADVSFCAPLSMYAEIKKGDIYVSDMFNLYKFENMLYTMELTGKEIKNFLEMSYALWTNQMKSPDDRLLLFSDDPENKYIFKNFSFNFDSAAGIIYTVDVTRSEGEKITIQSMADGSPFQSEKVYKVAVNSYRGNGGGNLLTKGAGIPKEDLAKRIIFATDKDLRFYLMKRIEEVKVLDPKPLNQWKMIPEEWTVPAARRDYDFLFNRNK